MRNLFYTTVIFLALLSDIMADNNLTEEEKDRRIETEIYTAKTIAEKLFRLVSAEEFVKEVPDPRLRTEVVNTQLQRMDDETGTKTYMSFGNAYPLVLKYMVQNFMYSSVALEKFIRKQAENPGKGMKGFIQHQANYVYQLHIILGKKQRKRGYLKLAQAARKAEYEIMDKVRKDMEKKEKEVRNEFEEEAEKHLEEKRKELLDFVNSELKDHVIPDDSSTDTDSDGDEPEAKFEEEMPEDDDSMEDNFAAPSPTEGMTEEEFRATLSPEDRAAREETDRFLAKLEGEEAVVSQPAKNMPSFLEGTIVDPKKNHKKKSKKKSKKKNHK